MFLEDCNPAATRLIYKSRFYLYYETMNNIVNTFRAFNHRNYRLFFAGQGISFLGSLMQSAAQGWLVYRLTDSAFMLGLVAFTGQFPAFFIAPFAGILSDRIDRRKLILAADILQMLQAIVLAALVIFGAVKPWHIIILSSILGIANGFEMTTRHAIVPDIVNNKNNLGNAIALNSGMFNLARIIGPSIAGFVVAYYGEGMCFAINAASYIAIIYALLAMKLPVNKYGGTATRPMNDLKEGYKYVFSFKPLRDIIFLMAFISLTGSSVIILLPVFARDILNGGPQMLGFLMAALGTGALTGAVYLASRKSIPGLGRVIVAALLVFGTAVCCLAFVSDKWPALFLLMAAGSGMMMHMASSNTLIQTIADDDKRGRAVSFYIMAFSGFGPIGNLIAGYAAKNFGVKITVLCAGFMTLAGAAVFAYNLKKMRVLLEPVYIKRGVLPAEDIIEPK